MVSAVIEKERSIPVRTEADVVVVGGGPAGSSAAIAAARLGAKTVLIERTGHLGGMATGGLVWMIHSMSDGTKTKLIQGIAQEWMDGLAAEGGIIRPTDEELGSEDEELIKMHGKMFFGTHGRLLYGGRFDTEILKHNLNQLVKKAGVELYFHSYGTRPIMENGVVKGVYFESVEGSQAILANTVIDCSGDGVIFNAAGADSTTEVSGANRLDKQALCFEFANVEVERAEQFRAEHRDEYEEMLKELAEEDGFTWFFRSIPQRPRSVHFNMFLNGYSLLKVADLTEIEISVRERMMATYRIYKKRLPGFEDSYIMITAPQIGARGSRRLIGQYTLCEKDAISGEMFEDAIAEFPPLYGNYPDKPHLFVPMRVLIPQKEIDGIICAGRCFSSDEIINDHYNTISHSIAMGQAAGTAAAISAQHGKTIRTVDIKLIQKSLVAQGVPLPSLNLQ